MTYEFWMGFGAGIVANFIASTLFMLGRWVYSFGKGKAFFQS